VRPGRTNSSRRRKGVRLGLRERDYDELILRHADVLASALREGALIAADSKPRPLGREVENIVVLFAEVGPGDVPPPRSVSSPRRGPRSSSQVERG
jgi:hypothetical protein